MERPQKPPLPLQALVSQRVLRGAIRQCSSRLKFLLVDKSLQKSSLLLGFAALSNSQRGRARAAEPGDGSRFGFGRRERRATDCLLLLNTACFAAQYFTNGRILLWGVKDNAAIMAGQWWRFLTPAFLHGGILHFLSNSYSLNNIGPTVERLSGSRRFLALYGLSAAVGTTFSYFGTPGYALGASGAIFGIVGSFAVFILRHREYLGPQMADRCLKDLAKVVGINLAVGLSPQVDNWAHLGGLLGGAAAAYLLGPRWFVDGKGLHDRPPIALFASKPREMR